MKKHPAPVLRYQNTIFEGDSFFKRCCGKTQDILSLSDSFVLPLHESMPCHLEAEKFFALWKPQRSTSDLLSLTYSVLKHITMCNWHGLCFFKLIQPSLFWKPEKARESIANTFCHLRFGSNPGAKVLLTPVQLWTGLGKGLCVWQELRNGQI